jgi:hypothetical protein
MIMSAIDPLNRANHIALLVVFLNLVRAIDSKAHPGSNSGLTSSETANTQL